MATGLELREARKAAGITAATLARAMGYGGKSPHARVFQIEALREVTPDMEARYTAALAGLKGGTA